MQRIKTVRPDWHYLIQVAAVFISIAAILHTGAALVVFGEAGFVHKGWKYGTPHLAALLLNVLDFVIFYEAKIGRSIFLFAVNVVAAYVMFLGFP